MIKATPDHKAIIVDIISKSFDDNKSVNWIIKQDERRNERIKALVEYSFEMCMRFGAVYMLENKKACALLLFPEKKSSLKTLLLDLKLVVHAIGVDRAIKIWKREELIKKLQPKDPFVYLWFIGVDPLFQGRGFGSQLMEDVIMEYDKPFCLETSAVRNLPWYKKLGFEIYRELDEFGYRIYMLKKI